MEILLWVVVGFVVLVIAGHIKGPPQPASMSIDQIAARIQSETAWINRYKALPIENQMGSGIRKQYESKLLYIEQLNVEFMKRGFEASGRNSKDSLIPIMERTLELRKSGMSEELAQKTATEEFVKKRPDLFAENSKE